MYTIITIYYYFSYLSLTGCDVDTHINPRFISFYCRRNAGEIHVKQALYTNISCVPVSGDWSQTFVCSSACSWNIVFVTCVKHCLVTSTWWPMRVKMYYFKIISLFFLEIYSVIRKTKSATVFLNFLLRSLYSIYWIVICVKSKLWGMTEKKIIGAQFILWFYHKIGDLF